jgi:hypothetical protein
MNFSNRKLKVVLFFLATFILLESLLVQIVLGEAICIGKEEALEIAKKETIKNGYDVSKMRIEASKYSTPYNPYLPDDEEATDPEEIEFLKQKRSKLENKIYWAVYFSPIELPGQRIFDGDTSVFIDSKTGQILLVR